jgi:hypothetical protein
MTLLRSALQPVAHAAGYLAARQLRAFLKAHHRTAEVQEELLLRMIRSAESSAFGRDHGFGKIRSYADFVSAMPVGDYETHRPYVDRVMRGEVEALFAPGTPIRMFAVTSGTTGQPKHIPVTAQFLSDYRRGWNMFGVRALLDHPDGWMRRIVTLTSRVRDTDSPSGRPCGSISGMMADTQKWIVRAMYCVPSAAKDITDPLAKYYVMLRSSITHDVGILTTANPSAAIRLAEVGRDHAERLIRDIRDGTVSPPGDNPPAWAGQPFSADPAAARRLEEIIRREGQLLPRHYWRPGFITLWTGGTVGLYLPKVRALYGDVPIRDIGLLASEGRLSVPLDDGTPSGVAEITSNFLEFIPAEQIGSPAPDVLRAEQVEVGGDYFVVITNWAGLYRYHINDRVRVTGKLGQSPVFAFLCKGQNASSITGEKITEHQVVEAMGKAAARLGASVTSFTLQGHFAELPYYQLRVEPQNGMNAQALADGLDQALADLNIEYRTKRASTRLGAIRAVVAPPGEFARQEAGIVSARQGAVEQYKHRYLLADVVNELAKP